MNAADCEIPGIISSTDIACTVDAIADVQLADGNIPWFVGGHTDPWNLVETAMALDVGGRHREAEAAYHWLHTMQRADGGWHAYYQGNDVKDATLDTNVSTYVAAGVLHHWLSTGDHRFVREQWPMVVRAIDFALAHQRPTGEIAWRADDPDDGALLTGSSSIHTALRCAILLADQLGDERPEWELALGALAHAIRTREPHFLEKQRWAMDWYYPVLCGAVTGDAAQTRLAAGWSTFVAPGRGVRCVSDHPWITAAETCELVLALDAIGARAQALEVFSDVQFLRHDDGGYWTGMNFAGDAFDQAGELFPLEQPTWNSAAVVLAANALANTSLTAPFFRGAGLPAGLSAAELLVDFRDAPASAVAEFPVEP
ncbi:MAG: prenyltransferase [Acidimicrobiia bacterium]